MLLVAFKAVSAPASDNGVSPTALTSASSVGHSMTPKSAEDNSESSKLAKHSAQRATVALRAMRKTDMCKYFPSPIEKEWTDASAKGTSALLDVLMFELWLKKRGSRARRLRQVMLPLLRGTRPKLMSKLLYSRRSRPRRA